MTFHIPDLSGMLLIYLLAFARTGSMIMLLPGIGDHGVPARVRLALALAVAYAMAPVVARAYAGIAPASATDLTIIIIGEVTAGVAVGAMARILMSALQVAGGLIATSTGLSYAQSVDPSFGGQDSTIGNFILLMGTTLIFVTNLHHLAIGAIMGSYTLIPPGGHFPASDLAQLAIRLVSGSFALGLQLAAPFIVFSFAVSAAIGLLARLMPQMQVFFIAMPINILAGFFLMMLLIGSMMTLFLSYFASEMARFTG